ncbi:hypothetical protein GCM10010978_23630 [Compostibacillus humi]|uniref:DUF3870 domain-containing protein n=1 Tax=Compostibacillus humi TaxID=1245525 RepID=A0A8J2TMG1_9BACI|nr:DUF3870 domain-containing protein [Compostibacillus humi]GFZ82133.1 hypothetical protein GCM10010978_23630 [Compostibacillus humi]
MTNNTIMCVGYSRLPEGMSARAVFGGMGVGFEIDASTGRIVNTSATFVTDMCSTFLENIFNGWEMDKGLEEPIREFENRYFGMGKKAIISAINDAYNQYLNYKSSLLVAK